jgi:uncharacterized SAM-binding protein YcdF (DUF218 family)
MSYFSGASLLGLWIGAAKAVFTWLMHPWLVVVPLVFLIFLPAWLGYSSWKISWQNPLVILLAVYWLVVTPPMASLAIAGLAALAPADSGDPAEAIVVLSRPGFIAKGRYEQAIQLWRDRRAPKIFVTSEENFVAMAQRLTRDRLPLQILSGTACARTTQDEALSTAALLGEQGIQQIILITDPPHLARSVKTFEGVGFSVIPHASPLPSTLTSPQKAALALRESAGLISYALLGRYWQGDRRQDPPVLRDVELRQCKLEVLTSKANLASVQIAPKS